MINLSLARIVFRGTYDPNSGELKVTPVSLTTNNKASLLLSLNTGKPDFELKNDLLCSLQITQGYLELNRKFQVLSASLND